MQNIPGQTISGELNKKTLVKVPSNGKASVSPQSSVDRRSMESFKRQLSNPEQKTEALPVRQSQQVAAVQEDNTNGQRKLRLMMSSNGRKSVSPQTSVDCQNSAGKPLGQSEKIPIGEEHMGDQKKIHLARPPNGKKSASPQTSVESQNSSNSQLSDATELASAAIPIRNSQQKSAEVSTRRLNPSSAEMRPTNGLVKTTSSESLKMHKRRSSVGCTNFNGTETIAYQQSLEYTGSATYKNRKASLPHQSFNRGLNDQFRRSSATRRTSAPEQKNFTVTYERVHGPADGAYKNESKPRGLIFMKNIEEFDDNKYSLRQGSKVDYANLLDLFQQMGYRKSQKYCETGHITKKKLMEDLEAFSKLDHRAYDSCIFILMSHGVHDKTFVCSDGEFVDLMDVYSMLNNTNCQHLRNKPKIFILQFCRPQSKSVNQVRTKTGVSYLSPSATEEFIELKINAAVYKMAEQLRKEFSAMFAEHSGTLLAVQKEPQIPGELITHKEHQDPEEHHSHQYKVPTIRELSPERTPGLSTSPALSESPEFPASPAYYPATPLQRRRNYSLDYLSSPNLVSYEHRHEHTVFPFDENDSELMPDAEAQDTDGCDAPSPDYSDMYSIFSTNSGGVAYRHPRKGSLLVQAICQVFAKHAYHEDIEGLVRRVSKWMQQEISKDNPLASHRHAVVERVNNGLDKAFYFNPTVLKSPKRHMTIAF
ncbi:uncharacterized protein LOC108666522 isoform X2 [Hyalella azteca]|nr:uncharacterized protein LOC108666522 isoform X2 [Hyalella azteca]